MRIFNGKKAVFLVGSYYPKYSAVGRCQSTICKEMIDNGFEVSVIAGNFNCPEDEDNLIIGEYGEKITRISVAKYIFQTNIKVKIIRFIIRFIKRIFSFNSLQKHIVVSYLNALDKLDHIPDIIIATQCPFETAYAAMEYKKKHPKCYVICCLYDMFANSKSLYMCHLEKVIKRRHNYALECDVFKSIDKIAYVPSWNNYFKNKHSDYIEKSIQIEHPLVIYPKELIGLKQNVNVTTKKTVFMFSGVLIRDYVEAKDFIDIIKSSKVLQDATYIFYSQGNAVKDIECVYELDIHIQNWIPHNELVIKQFQADILVNIAEKTGQQISSKIFEYMCIGKPILHIYYVDNDVNLYYLRKYSLALCIKIKPDSILENGRSIEKWLNNVKGKMCLFDNVAKNFKELTPQYICTQILTM